MIPRWSERLKGNTAPSRTVSEVLLALFERLVHRVQHGRERVAVGDRAFEDPLVECALRRGQQGRRRVRVVLGVGCFKLTLASYPLSPRSARFQRDTTAGYGNATHMPRLSVM
jgi:hypothetical protein